MPRRSLTRRARLKGSAVIQLERSSPGGIGARLPAQPTSLIERDRDVAALVARGLTNRALAAELVVTEGVAAKYVQHIRETLGFHSRAQIAAWAVERGLPPDP